MEKYTVTGILGILDVLNRKEAEMHDAIIACHKRRKDEHPRYMAMTDEEFKKYKVEFIREMNRHRKANKEEIARFEKML